MASPRPLEESPDRPSNAGLCSETKPADGVSLDHPKVDLVAEQISDVVDTVQDHGWPFEAQAPCDYVHILWKPHWAQHLWSEHAAVAHLNPFLQLLRVTAEHTPSSDGLSEHRQPVSDGSFFRCGFVLAAWLAFDATAGFQMSNTTFVCCVKTLEWSYPAH